MADDKPPFDPSAAFSTEKPAFDPNAAFTTEAPKSGMSYDVAASGAAGVGKGISSFLGAAGDVRNLASRATDAMFSPETAQTIKNIGSRIPEGVPILGAIAHAPTSEQVQHGIEGVTGEFHKPETTPGRYAETAGSFLGNPGSYLGPGSLPAKAIGAGLAGVGSEAAGQALEGTSAEGPARLAGAFLAGPLAARAVKPQLGAAQQTLADAGVTQMTPGQLLGGPLKAVEDKLTSMPILGDFIASGRNRSIGSFNRAVGNQALEPIGEKLAPKTAPGHDMVSEVERKLSNKYDQLVPHLQFNPDPQYLADLRNIHNEVNLLPPQYAEQFQNILDNKLGRPIPLSGRQVKKIESDLNRIGAKYAGDIDSDKRDVGHAVTDVVRAIRDTMERSNPAFAQQLRNINTGWAMYARMRSAAANRATSAGVFMPSDLLAAVKRGDKSVGKGAFARGDALMQDFAEAGQAVLPSKLSESGTAPRLMMNTIVGGSLAGGALFTPAAIAAGAGTIGAGLPYLKPSQYLLHRYTQPTTGLRAGYSNIGRGAGTLRPLAQVNPFAYGNNNPYSP